MLKLSGVQKTRELLSQRKRGPRKPFAVRLSNGQRVRISDPQCIAITPQTLFIARSTGAIARIDLREIEAIENLPGRARKCA